MTDMNAEGAELSAEQIDDLRRAVRAAASVSHVELAGVCSRLMRDFAISYRELRQIADVPLPDYLAGVPADPARQVRSDPIPELTAEQMAELLNAYRDLLSTAAPAAAVRKRLEVFAGRFGTRVYLLKRLLAADERANRQLYEELRAAGKQKRVAAEAQRKAAKAQRKAERVRQEGARAGKSRRKAGKSRRSVWTVSGGLPGLGRRS
ncbi:hypothetical protein ABQE69_10770 [Mycolicibacillus trivialis]